MPLREPTEIGCQDGCPRIWEGYWANTRGLGCVFGGASSARLGQASWNLCVYTSLEVHRGHREATGLKRASGNPWEIKHLKNFLEIKHLSSTRKHYRNQALISHWFYWSFFLSIFHNKTTSISPRFENVKLYLNVFSDWFCFDYRFFSFDFWRKYCIIVI